MVFFWKVKYQHQPTDGVNYIQVKMFWGDATYCYVTCVLVLRPIIYINNKLKISGQP